MNKIVASVGLVALGAAGLQTVSAVDSPNGNKPWSVSATLRGFYDDNPAGLPASFSVPNRGSFGYSASPAITLAMQNDQSSLSMGYTFSAIWYQHRPFGETDNYDLDHTFNLALNHSFNERYKVGVVESFVVGQEPDTLRAGNVFNNFQRVPGDNVRNFGSITFDATLTPLFGLEAGFANAFYDYRSAPGGVPPADPELTPPDLQGLLNRIENTFHLDGRYQWLPDTVLILGYQFMNVSYLANEEIDGPTGPSPEGPLFSRVRNNRSQYGYLGVDHSFRPDFTGSLRVGARYNSYYNDPTSQSEPSPYLMGTTRYTYATDSYVEAGVSYDRSTTDLFSYSAANGSITTDAQSAAFWVTWNHRITPKVYGNLVAQVQNSTYNGGQLDSDVDMYYLVGLNLQYRFTQNFTAEVGYNYDRLDSDSAINTYVQNQTGLARSFDRNRVYVGVTASY
jgi:Putative beta-barrel porin 2